MLHFCVARPMTLFFRFFFAAFSQKKAPCAGLVSGLAKKMKTLSVRQQIALRNYQRASYARRPPVKEFAFRFRLSVPFVRRALAGRGILPKCIRKSVCAVKLKQKKPKNCTSFHRELPKLLKKANCLRRVQRLHKPVRERIHTEKRRAQRQNYVHPDEFEIYASQSSQMAMRANLNR